MPGALEIPQVLNFQYNISNNTSFAYEGYIALGCVIKGETYHFEIVSNETNRGLMNIALKHFFPLGNGVITAYNYDQALKVCDLNFKLGIGGVVTFKNGGLDRYLNKIPIDNIVLETDSPYLAPSPHRGKRNESSYIIYTLDKLSEIYQLDNDYIADATTKNATDIFNLKK